MKSRRTLEVIVFALVLALALFLRVRHLDTTPIGADQAFTLNTAMRWVNGGKMPLAANKSSIGVMNPPMIEYLYAAALRCWPDILSVAILTMVSGLIAIAATGWATYRVLGRRVAFWAVLIFAVNPWSVHYSQLIWNQTMVPIFSSLMLACLLVYFVVEQRAILLILSFVWAACMTQVHLGTAIQLLTMAVVCVLFWRKLKVLPLVIGAASFVLLYVPFLLYQSSVGWADVQTALRTTGEPASLSPAAVLVSLDLLHARGLLDAAKHVATFDTVATVLFAIALGYVVYRMVRETLRRDRDPEASRRFNAAVILLLWLILPILFYLRSSHYLQNYYLIGQLPAPFILMSLGLDGLYRRLADSASSIRLPAARRGARIAVWALLYIPLILLLGWQASFDLRLQDQRYHATHGPPQIRHLRATIETSRRLLNEHPDCSLVALAEGHTVETSQLSVLREFVSRDRVLLADGDLAAPVPRPCALYLDTQGTSRASSWLRETATPLAEETLQVLDERWRFFRIADPAEILGAAETETTTPDARWENGVALTAYQRGRLRPGATLPLTLTWSIQSNGSTQSPGSRQSPGPNIVYHFGTYLLSTGDQVVAQSDGPGFDSIQWRSGDAFITWFQLPVPEDLPPGDYRIAVALYSWPAIERVNVSSGGNMVYLGRIAHP